MGQVCSVYLARLLSCCSVPVMLLPSLSFTGRSGLLYLPASFQLALLLLPDVDEVAFVQFYTLLYLSLLAIVCSSCACASAILVRLLFTADFSSFRTWILRQVSAVIQCFSYCFFRPTMSGQVDVSVCVVFSHRRFGSGSSSCNSCNTLNLFSVARFSLSCLGIFQEADTILSSDCCCRHPMFLQLDFQSCNQLTVVGCHVCSPVHSHIFQSPPKSPSYANVIYLVLCRVIR